MNRYFILLNATKCLRRTKLLVWGLFVCLATSSAAQDNAVKIPQFINPNTVTTSGSTATIRTIRFLTTDDFPPFSFIDPQGRLEGFNIALARALCREIKARCTMQALPWDLLREGLAAGQGDAIIAGLKQSDETIREYAFSAPYLRLPARFFATKVTSDEIGAFKTPDTRTVGVVAGTAHEAFLRELFADTPRHTFSDIDALRDAVKDGIVPLGFADGVGTSFWLQSGGSRECCTFVGGPYLNSRFFGEGLSIAVPIDRLDLKEVLDDGLGRLMRKGKYAEIYLRFFPVNFF